MKKLFSLLFFLASLTLCGSEIDLSSLAPSYTAVAGKADVAVLLQMPQIRQFLSLAPADVRSAAQNDVAAAIFGSDKNLKRIFLICRFRDEAAWQRLWRTLDGRIAPLPAERRIMLFKLKDDRLPGSIYFAVLAPRVAAFYYAESEQKNFRCDYAGAPERVKPYLRAPMPLICGGRINVRKGVLRGVRSLYIALENDESGNLSAMVINCNCRDRITAGVTAIALQGMISAGLQTFCGMSPEETADFINRIKIRQNEKNVQFRFSDFGYLFGKIEDKVVRQ